MSRILILGGGKFGLQASQRLSGKEINRVTIVDTDPKRCESAGGPGREVFNADGISYLADSLKVPDPPDWIIPAVPLHVAFEWLRTVLPAGKTLDLLPVPEQVRVQLPNPLAGTGGALYMSYADFICPTDCPEPAEFCTFTGKARKGTLHRTLAQIQVAGFAPVVVRSRQLAPGVGGYRPADLFTMLTAVWNANSPILLSTACKCHGVMQAFRIT